MTTTTPWAHLPNAVHIDRVLASLNSNFKQWRRAAYTVQGYEWVEVQNSAWHSARQVVRVQSRDAAWVEVRKTVIAQRRLAWAEAWGVDAAYDVVWDAIVALVAYDDCAYMLDSDPGELAILAKFGDHRAILLLVACKTLHSLKELV